MPNSEPNLATLAEQITAIGVDLHAFRKEVCGNGQEGRIQRIERTAREADDRVRGLEINGTQGLRAEIARVEERIDEIRASTEKHESDVSELKQNRKWYEGRRGIITSIVSALVGVIMLGGGQLLSYFLTAHQRNLDTVQATGSATGNTQQIDQLQAQMQQLQKTLDQHEADARARGQR